jgi:hypothetical protein
MIFLNDSLKVLCESLFFTISDRRGATGLKAAFAKLSHEVTNRKPAADIFFRIQFSAGIKSKSTFFNCPVSKRDIGSNYKITLMDDLGNFIICFIIGCGYFQ